jgi:hypothetical protein
MVTPGRFGGGDGVDDAGVHVADRSATHAVGRVQGQLGGGDGAVVVVAEADPRGAGVVQERGEHAVVGVGVHEVVDVGPLDDAVDVVHEDLHGAVDDGHVGQSELLHGQARAGADVDLVAGDALGDGDRGRASVDGHEDVGVGLVGDRAVDGLDVVGDDLGAGGHEDGRPGVGGLEGDGAVGRDAVARAVAEQVGDLEQGQALGRGRQERLLLETVAVVGEAVPEVGEQLDQEHAEVALGAGYPLRELAGGVVQQGGLEALVVPAGVVDGGYVSH